MKILLITYNLKEESKKYINELSAIIETASSWLHYLDNTWLIKTDETARSWYEKITANRFKDDLFLIVEVQPNNYWGRLPSDAWDWFKDTVKFKSMNSF